MRDIQQVFAGNNPHPTSELNHMRFNENKRTDEIDLIEVLSFLVRTIKRYQTLIVGAIVVAIIGGVLASHVLKPSVKKELVCQIYNVDREAVSSMLIEFESVDNGRREGPLNGLKAIRLKEDNGVVDPNKPFIIEGKFDANADVPAIQNLLIKHIETNEFVKARVETELEKMKKTIAMLKADERKISGLLNNAERLESESFSIADMSKLKMDFYKERIALEGKVKSYSAVEVVQDFTGREPSDTKSLILIFGISLAISLFLAATIIAVREVGLAVSRYERRIAIAENGFNVSRGITEQLHHQQKKVSSI